MRLCQPTRHARYASTRRGRGGRSTRAIVEAIEGRTLLSSYHLTFSDEFNNLNLATTATSTNPWSAIDYWNNHYYVDTDDQYYATPHNENYNPFSVSSGVLTITAKPTPAGFDADGKKWVSGQITTARRNQDNTNLGGKGFSQKYGYFEARAKMPPGSGFWPAFWLLPANGSSETEIDIAEGLGNDPTGVYQTVHWGGDGDAHRQDGDVYQGHINTTDGFHVYGLEWKADTISWYVDGVKTRTTTNRSNTAMYMVVNLAIGGWNGNDVTADTSFPGKFAIDYVRVYSDNPQVPAVTPGTGYAINPNTLPISVNGLDNGFNQVDIGSPGARGSGTYANGLYTIKGSGTDIGPTSDTFHFASRALRGDGALVARITGLSANDSQAKAGVMIRDGWTANAPFASVMEMPGHVVKFRWRAIPGGTVKAATVTVPPGATFLRLTRVGDTFSGFYSANGLTWTAIGTAQAISMPQTTQAGLAITSHNNTQLATATFDKVAITPALLPRAAWVASASNTFQYSSAENGVDDNTGTRYANGVQTAAAQWYQIDLRWAQSFQRVQVDQGADADYYLPGYRLLVSTDGKNWGATIATASAASRYVTLTAAGVVTARYVRLMPTAFTWNWWGITEVTLSRPIPVAPTGSLPAGWSSADVGGPGKAGSASVTSGTWKINGGGTRIHGTSDQFHFASTAASGNRTLVARVTSLTNTNIASRAGVMFRDTTADNAMYASVFVTPGRGIRFSYRSATGASVITTGPANVKAPVWVKLVRSGNTFSGYYAMTTATPAASQWIKIGSSATISFSNTSYLAGLAVNANDNSRLATATFTGLSLTTG
jgi:beta-glucanase (GH16 family)